MCYSEAQGHLLGVGSKPYWRETSSWSNVDPPAQGNHQIVRPDEAAAYFAASREGELSPRGGYVAGEDLFLLTPYHTYSDRCSLTT